MKPLPTRHRHRRPHLPMIELLAPAGGMESLRAAADFGADAVYAAGKAYGLRAFADNFTPDDMAEGAAYLHSRGKRLFITMNAVFHPGDFHGLKDYISLLAQTGVDAFIVSDPGVLITAKQTAPQIPVHISTQANTTNALTARFWHEQGASRVILARELSLSEIADIRSNTPQELELEAFVHGAMCIAYSGRCLLSNVFTGRSGNGGACAQPCRWEYQISEKGYPNEYFPILSDERGTYVLNSKDLCMIEHLSDMIDAGIVSLKIEGRMKSAYYVACVTRAYRQALDDAQAGRPFEPTLLDEIGKAGSRAYTTGFFYGNPREQGQDIKRGKVERTCDFVGVVKAVTDENGWTLFEQRGKFSVGDTLEVLSPSGIGSVTIGGLQTLEGEDRQSAPHPKEMLKLKSESKLLPGDMLRISREKQINA